MKGCTIDGCDRPHYARGRCKVHESRRKRTGTTELMKRPWTAADDAAVMDLPVSPRSGYIVRGEREALALMMERSPAAITMRRTNLRRDAAR